MSNINRYQDLFNQLTIEEKLSLFDGKNSWQTNPIERLNIKSIWMSDGPHGLRKEYLKEDGIGCYGCHEAVVFPPACLSSCSFDPELLYLEGLNIAKQANHNQVGLLLGPGLNIKRHPLCGRNFEYFSEDPFLSGMLGLGFCKGVQSQNVGACLKHYACNSQETNRFVYSSEVDMQTLNDLYLKSFALICKSMDVEAVMGCYNRVNGEYGCQNDYLLNKALRKRFNFNGFVVSDWGACFDPVASFKNGLNLQMPGHNLYVRKTILKAYYEHKISEEEINKAILPIFNFIMDHQNDSINLDYDECDIYSIAKKVALESIVLAKNDDDILPIKKNEKVAVIGQFAKKMHCQGGGSSYISNSKITSCYEAFIKNNDEFVYADGYDIKSESTNEYLLKQAKDVAKNADKVILFAGLFNSQESEGFDRHNMSLSSWFIDLIDEIYEVNQNIVIVLQVGAPVELPFINKIKGVLIPYLCGSMGGEALRDIIYGFSSPCGHLAETWPKSLNDTYLKSNYPDVHKSVLYNEGMYVGYRYYQSQNINPLFCFGHGLSYSKFKYHNFKFLENKITFTIENVSDMGGKCLIQLYVDDHQNPFKQLKGFKKVYVSPHQKIDVEMDIVDEMFTYYSDVKDDYVIKTGNYTICLATSSQDIIFEYNIDIVGEENIKPYPFELNIKPTPIKDNSIKGNFDLNTTLKEVRSCYLGRILYKKICQILKKSFLDKDDETLNFMLLSLNDLPMRGLVTFGSEQGMTIDFVLGLIDCLNGHYLKGIKKIIDANKK